MSKDIVFNKFGANSRAFLQRAREHIAKFDEGSVESIFYAALELRFGIEARLNEYLQATLKSARSGAHNVTEFAATKLLRMLTRLAPEAEHPTQLVVTSEQSGSSSGFEYTPVTPRLAAMHGQLGELLHFKFFRNNPLWYLRRPLDEKPHRSLANYRLFLNDVVDELAYATRGTLLTHPQFTAFVEKLAESEDEGNDA